MIDVEYVVVLMQPGKKAETEPLYRLARSYREEAQEQYSATPYFEDLAESLIEFYNKQNKTEVLMPVMVDVLEATRDALGPMRILILGL